MSYEFVATEKKEAKKLVNGTRTTMKIHYVELCDRGGGIKNKKMLSNVKVSFI